MYALVEIKGKQYRVERDTTVKVDRIGSEPGTELEFPNVVFLHDGSAVHVGTPYVNGASVKAELAEHGRDDKVRVFKHKRRKNYRRTKGHRRQFSTIRIKDIAQA